MVISKVPVVGEGQTYWKLTNRRTAPHQLTSSAEPLPFWYERHTITLLMNGQVTAIAEHYCVGILAVTVVTDSTL